MEDLNKMLTTVSLIRGIISIFREPVSYDEYFIQRPPLSIDEKASFIKLTVAVYYQNDTQEAAVGADTQICESQRLPLPRSTDGMP